jgi:hypothetical protein
MAKHIFIFLLLVAVAATGCFRAPEVDFAWFNVSEHEIMVTDVSGLPPEASPGVLVVVSDDTNRLNRACSTFSESVPIGETIRIAWDEAGASRRYEVRRSDLNLPPRLHGGQVRFTYLGQGKWRVRFSPENI